VPDQARKTSLSPSCQRVSFATIIVVLLLPLAAIWILPVVADIAAIVCALFKTRKVDAAPPSIRPRLLFLVPAHNESLLIGECVFSLVAMSPRRTDFEVVVVADNCTDDTAKVAASFGATVLKRADASRPGKPAAIEWALSQLPLTGFDAVTIIDADTTVDPEFAAVLAEHAPLRDKAVQTYNGIGNNTESWLTALGALLVTVRYDGQFLLKRRAGFNCPMANGMTMGTGLLGRAGWAPDSLTENWELYARWTELGECIDFAPRAKLGSQEAKSLAQSSTQRRRWQAGRLLVFRQHALGILRSRRIGWGQKIDALSELSAPGPVLHASIATLCAVTLSLLPGMPARLLASVFAVTLLPMTLWTVVALRHQSNRGQVVAALARLPFYAVWRIAVAVMAISTARRGSWIRSPRHVTETV
jgi:cellulose synthase/poly-beta-1,6-N-acetylglucosamine synthase-like glycosyltransferase